MRLARGATAVAVLAIALVLAGRAPGAWACSCVPASGAEHYQNAEVVFVGVVTERTDPHEDDEIQSGGSAIHYTVEVRSEQKGDVSDPVLVKSSRSEASCGYTFRVGRRYQVFGREQADGDVTTGLCDGNDRLSDGEAPFVLAGTLDRKSVV